MQNIKLSKGFAYTVIAILAIWFLGPHILFSASEKNHNQNLANFEQQIEDRKNRVNDSIKTLQLSDKNLEKCIRTLAMERARIHPNNSGGIDDVRELKNIYCPRKNIVSLSGLEHFHHLQFLDLSNNNIDDISSLENLTNLRSLYLNGNPLTDIWPLKHLIGLKEVSLPSLDNIDCADFKEVVSGIKTNSPTPHCEEQELSKSEKPAPISDKSSYTLSRKEEEELLDFEFEQNRRFD